MVIMKIDLNLEEGVDHLCTDWQVSETIDFKSIVLESLKDDESLKSKVFSYSLDPTKTYYGRARVLLTTGWTVWGNVDIFTTDQKDGLDTLADLPSRISVPRIETRSNYMDGSTLLDVNKHPLALFDIVAEGFKVIGNATHYATSWIIEDVDGIVQWSSLTNSIYKDHIGVSDILLKENAVYRIKVLFHGSNNDISPVATYTIRTSNSSDIHLNTYIDNVNHNEQRVLYINELNNVTSVRWSVYGFVKDIAYKVFDQTSTGGSYNTMILPNNRLVSDTNYLLKIEPLDGDYEPKYVPFRTNYTGLTQVSILVGGDTLKITELDQVLTATIETDASNVTINNDYSDIITTTLSDDMKTLEIKLKEGIVLKSDLYGVYNVSIYGTSDVLESYTYNIVVQVDVKMPVFNVIATIGDDTTTDPDGDSVGIAKGYSKLFTVQSVDTDSYEELDSTTANEDNGDIDFIIKK